MEETNYSRTLTPTNGTRSPDLDKAGVQKAEDACAKDQDNTGHTGEKPMDTNYVENKQLESVTSGLPTQPSAEISYGNTEPRQKAAYYTRLNPMTLDGFRKPNHVVMRMRRTIQFLSFPVIFYAGFSYGVYIVWLALFNATQSWFLADAPYNFSTSQVGLTFIAPLVGTTLG